MEAWNACVVGAVMVCACAASDDGGGNETRAGAGSGGSDGGLTSSAGSGDPMVELGPCGRLADCIDMRDDPITPFLSTYGPNGTCWEEFTAEQCWQDCRGLFEGYAVECPGEPACCECSTVEDCAYSAELDSCMNNQCISLEDANGCDLVEQMCDDSEVYISIFTDFCEQQQCAFEAGAFANCLFVDGGDLCARLIACFPELSSCGPASCATQLAAFEQCVLG